MLIFKIVNTQEDYKTCLDIRREVFIIEQNVSLERDVDEYEDISRHFLVFKNEIPVATARLLKKNAFQAKIERVAVLKKYRKQSIGKYIMIQIIEYSKTQGFKKLILSSQTHALKFYRNLGFKEYGEEFMDANIPHMMMQLYINNF